MMRVVRGFSEKSWGDRRRVGWKTSEIVCPRALLYGRDTQSHTSCFQKVGKTRGEEAKLNMMIKYENRFVRLIVFSPPTPPPASPFKDCRLETVCLDMFDLYTCVGSHLHCYTGTDDMRFFFASPLFWCHFRFDVQPRCISLQQGAVSGKTCFVRTDIFIYFCAMEKRFCDVSPRFCIHWPIFWQIEPRRRMLRNPPRDESNLVRLYWKVNTF